MCPLSLSLFVNQSVLSNEAVTANESWSVNHNYTDSGSVSLSAYQWVEIVRMWVSVARLSSDCYLSHVLLSVCCNMSLLFVCGLCLSLFLSFVTAVCLLVCHLCNIDKTKYTLRHSVKSNVLHIKSFNWNFYLPNCNDSRVGWGFVSKLVQT